VVSRSRAPLPVPLVDAAVPLAAGTVDVRSRVLVAGVVPPPRFGREAEVVASAAALVAAGADLVDVSLPPRLAGPVAATPGTSVAMQADTVDAAVAAARVGARVVLVAPSLADAASASVAAVGRGDRTTVAIVVGDLADVPAGRAATGPRRLALVFDATRWSGAEAMARESAALVAGCRVLRTTDVRRSRRVAEVLGALLAAADEPDHDLAIPPIAGVPAGRDPDRGSSR
jgi:hypothetical protein